MSATGASSASSGHYGLAVFSSLAALVATIAVSSYSPLPGLLPFVIAATWSAQNGGRGPGLLAALLGAAAGGYLCFRGWLPGLLGEPNGAAHLGLYAILAPLAILWTSGRRSEPLASTDPTRLATARDLPPDHSTTALERSPMEDRKGPSTELESLRAAESLMRQRLEALSQMSRELMHPSSTDESAFARLARVVVPGLADWSAVDLVEPDGRIHRIAAAHRDPRKEPLIYEPRRFRPIDVNASGPVPEAVRTGRSVLIPDIAFVSREDAARLLETSGRDPAYLDLVQELGLRSVMVVPIVGPRGAMGALSLISGRPDRCYEPADLVLAEHVAAQAVLLSECAHLGRQASEAWRRSERSEETARIAEARADALEDERTEAWEAFRGLLAGLAGPTVVVDRDGQLVDGNPAAAALLGYTREQLRGIWLSELTATSQTWSAQERARFAHEGYWRGRLMLRRRDGTSVPVDLRISAVDLSASIIYVATLRELSPGSGLPDAARDLTAAALPAARRTLRALGTVACRLVESASQAGHPGRDSRSEHRGTRSGRPRPPAPAAPGDEGSSARPSHRRQSP